MSELAFVDHLPEPAAGGGTSWRQVLAPVAARPGAWAVVRTFDTALQAAQAAYNLRTGRLRAPEGEWEFAARTVDGEHRLYARIAEGAA